MRVSGNGRAKPTGVPNRVIPALTMTKTNMVVD